MMNRPLDRQMFADVHDELLRVLPETLGKWLDTQPYEYENDGVLNQFYHSSSAFSLSSSFNSGRE